MKSQGFIQPKGLSTVADIDRIQFSILGPEEIISWAVMEVTEHNIYEGVNPKRGGVNDTRMGIVKIGQKCDTCGQSKDCQGHFGFIKLTQPVFHLGYLPFIEKILKCICHNCSKLKCFSSDPQKQRFQTIMRISNPKKRFDQLVNLLASINKCPLNDQDGEKLGCGSFIPNKISVKEKMRLQVVEKDDRNNNKQQVDYSPKRVLNILEKIHPQDARILGFIQTKPAHLIISVLAVAPPQIRPSVELGPEKRAEDDITNAYAKIVYLNKTILAGCDNFEKAQNWKDIQKLTASIMVKLDKRYLPVVKDKHYGKKNTVRKIKSLEERLVAKEGRFRQHLMGKRVDFSARSVISPDPLIALDELGVPQKIAKSLTFPQQINEFNYNKILEMCKNGKVKFLIQPQVGSKQQNFIYLNKYSAEQIQQFLCIGMIAERQIEDGDYVLFNRQPTLHRMSMMGHRVKILPHNTFRLNLSVCSPYNADFDGDQMNMHVPQSVQAQAELQFIASVPNQIINPKNSTPIMGIVQDSLLGVYLLTMRDTFLTRAQIMNLIMWIDPMTKFNEGDLPMPCILKPQVLWSGKQIVSMMIPEGITLNMNIKSASLTNINDTQNLVIKNGDLLSGVLQRDHVGPGCGKLIQSIWVERGPEQTCVFITNVQRVVTNWLMSNGFTVGFADIKSSDEIEHLRENQIEKIKVQYYLNINKFRCLPKYQHENFHQKGKKVAESLQYKINLDLNNALSRMQKIVSQQVKPQINNVLKMITAKSKGSLTNLTQIMFSLGNQNVDGKRCPQGFRKRALPHFSKDDNSPQPRGFVFSSFFKGLKPHQFFFHSMAGRQGLSDTAVKTSSIGYIQRKLVKALEDLSVRYDGTVRDSKQNILQRFYGEDGFQPQFIERHQLNQCLGSQSKFQEKYLWSRQTLQLYGYDDKILQIFDEEYLFLLYGRNQLRERLFKALESSIFYNCPINIERLIQQQAENSQEESQMLNPFEVVTMVEELSYECLMPRFKKDYRFEVGQLLESRESSKISNTEFIVKKFQKLKQYGAQIFHIHLKFWLNSKKIITQYQMTYNQLRNIIGKIHSKFMRVLAPAGQAIGSLAAQSIGQPTTQMTLNTFHLAGVSDKNVTLGIPRLRQLLDVSKNIKTPYITIYYHQPIEWHQRQDSQVKEIQNNIISMMPERHLKDYLTTTSIYYDTEWTEENGEGKQLSQNVNYTPWVLHLKFDIQKVTSPAIWRKILKKLQVTCKEFYVKEHIGIGQRDAPQIKLLLLGQSLARINNVKAFRHLSFRENQFRDIFLTGIKGIKSIKTAKKLKHECNSSQEIVVVTNPNNEDISQRRYELVFEAMGSNLKEVLSNNYIDSKRTTSNSLRQVYDTLGVQAARQLFINQFKEILKPYSIYINDRHLSVLSDWMTCRGNIVPINRHGINRVRDVSVLRKATFEQTADILYNASVFSQVDELKGVSQKIIFGQKLNLGTNSCRVYLDASKTDQFIYQPSNTIIPKEQKQQKEEINADPETQPEVQQTPEYKTSQFYNNQIIDDNKSAAVSPKRSLPFLPQYDSQKMRENITNKNIKNPAQFSYSPQYLHNQQEDYNEDPTARENSRSPSYDPKRYNSQSPDYQQRYLSQSPSYMDRYTSQSPNYDSDDNIPNMGTRQMRPFNYDRPIRPTEGRSNLKRQQESDSDSEEQDE